MREEDAVCGVASSPKWKWRGVLGQGTLPNLRKRIRRKRGSRGGIWNWLRKRGSPVNELASQRISEECYNNAVSRASDQPVFRNIQLPHPWCLTPLHQSFELLPSGRFKVPLTKKLLYNKSFHPNAIHIQNSFYWNITHCLTSIKRKMSNMATY